MTAIASHRRVRNDQHHDHGSCVADVVATAERRASSSGGRLTPLRRTVLELISASHKPVGAYDLLDQLVRERKGRAAPPTVYRTLDFLLGCGLIHRIAS